MPQTEVNADGIAVARDYYDSSEADDFYATIWGGEDIHIGIYADTRDIREASRATVDRMAGKLDDLAGARVLDLGSGFGGAARVLAREHDAHVTCLNLSTVENERNRELTAQAGLDGRIEVVDGSFDDLPFEDAQFDVAWSQDAILHAPDRRRVLDEVARVLKAGGDFLFTDPMQADGLADTSALRPIYDRIHLSDLASIYFYEAELSRRGFQKVGIEPMVHELRNHYARVAQELDERREELEADDAFIERMLAGLNHWVQGADQGLLSWGILHFRKFGSRA